MTVSENNHQKMLSGIGVGSGRVAGILCFFNRVSKEQKSDVTINTPQDEWNRLENALQTTAKRLDGLYKRTLQSVGEEEAKIFEIHAMLLEDEDFLDALRTEHRHGRTAEETLRGATKNIISMLEELNDPYLSARAADIRDLGAQILQVLLGEEVAPPKPGDSPFILVADDLSPSETVLLDRSRILGFVTLHGTPNSHTAILARAMGIPALVSVGSIPREADGSYALLDAAEGTLTLSPTDEQIKAFTDKKYRDDRIAEEHDHYLRSLMNKPAITRGGHRILIYANIGSGNEVEASLSGGAEGIGLLRSEFLYLSENNYPDEEKLFCAYRDIALKMQGKRTVIRTLDVGADKKIAYFDLPEEENPALGFRAIRICLARKELFKTQLRAILRASAVGRIAVMLPMIVSLDEVRQSKHLLEECKTELHRENRLFDNELELGIMIETPASVTMCTELASEVDFFSVGTNDLIQYALAADRQNPSLAELCENNAEPILRMIEQAAKAIHDVGGWIGICGEMAADLRYTQRFADMRVDELSVSPPYLLGIRGKVTECI